MISPASASPSFLWASLLESRPTHAAQSTATRCPCRRMGGDADSSYSVRVLSKVNRSGRAQKCGRHRHAPTGADKPFSYRVGQCRSDRSKILWWLACKKHCRADRSLLINLAQVRWRVEFPCAIDDSQIKVCEASLRHQSLGRVPFCKLMKIRPRSGTRANPTTIARCEFIHF